MTRSNRRHWEPEPITEGFLQAVTNVLEGDALRDFWPVTLRGVHYAMLDAPRVQIGVDKKKKPVFYENTVACYKKLGILLAKARISGRIPWNAIADNHRERHDNGGGFESAKQFIDQCQEDFLKGYHRDLLQSQAVVLEVWVEKDTVARYVNEVAEEYDVSVVIARGYGSVSFVHDLAGRIREARRDSKTMKVLYFGDLDPSGVNMLKAMQTTLHEEMGVDADDVAFLRCAINEKHVSRFKLKSNPDALKDDAWQERQRARGLTDKAKGDPRAEAYKDEYGKVAVELDALGPARLQKLVREAIEKNLDMDAFREEQRQQDRDEARIEKLRDKFEALAEE